MYPTKFMWNSGGWINSEIRCLEVRILKRSLSNRFYNHLNLKENLCNEDNATTDPGKKSVKCPYFSIEKCKNWYLKMVAKDLDHHQMFINPLFTVFIVNLLKPFSKKHLLETLYGTSLWYVPKFCCLLSFSWYRIL